MWEASCCKLDKDLTTSLLSFSLFLRPLDFLYSSCLPWLLQKAKARVSLRQYLREGTPCTRTFMCSNCWKEEGKPQTTYTHTHTHLLSSLLLQARTYYAAFCYHLPSQKAFWLLRTKNFDRIDPAKALLTCVLSSSDWPWRLKDYRFWLFSLPIQDYPEAISWLRASCKLWIHYSSTLKKLACSLHVNGHWRERGCYCIKHRPNTASISFITQTLTTTRTAQGRIILALKGIETQVLTWTKTSSL